MITKEQHSPRVCKNCGDKFTPDRYSQPPFDLCPYCFAVASDSNEPWPPTLSQDEERRKGKTGFQTVKIEDYDETEIEVEDEKFSAPRGKEDK